jgi:ferredoxin
MSIKDALPNISRRTLLGGGGAVVAAAVAVPAVFTITHKVEKLNARKRIVQFINDFLDKGTVSVYNAYTAGRPESHHVNSLRDSRLNTTGELNNTRVLDTPVIGFASAHDPYFEKLKEADVVGPNHFTPEQWLPGAKTVISYFHPYTEEVRATQRISPTVPSATQVAAKAAADFYLETMGRALGQFIEGLGGYASMVPTIDPRYQGPPSNLSLGQDASNLRAASGLTQYQYGSEHDPNPQKFLQDHHLSRQDPERSVEVAADRSGRQRHRPAWSERHVAFIAGVGTFGLQRSLLTEKGTLGRIGSLVTTLELPPTVRPYGDNYHGYCPYFLDGSCEVCVGRCPGKAISKDGYKDQTQKCSAYHAANIIPLFQPSAYSGECSKCMSNVPCEKSFHPSIRSRYKLA